MTVSVGGFATVGGGGANRLRCVTPTASASHSAHPRAVITRDDFIGSTSIDLEDRIFEPAWVALGQNEQTPTRLAPKPIEWRDLWAPSSKTSQGALRLWVDILTPDQAVKYPPIDIKPPPPRGYQLRAIVWKAEGMETGDTMSGMNDLKFCGWMLDEKGKEMKQWTDVHWRAKKGKGSFNWRMVWDVKLPRKFFYFTIQAWDQDIMKVRTELGRLAFPVRLAVHCSSPSLTLAQYSDCLGENHLNLGPHVRRALRQPTKALQILRTDSDVMKARKAKQEEQVRCFMKATGIGGV